ncbi:dTDP-4-dehydrorhamnose 3,5-epimerase [Halalkalibacter wakoensis JCM 9140]|uniref:dTDP-4-dehydrorhamnose 3,5-epimerase n=1 Tax=Halalkalibacter wakoensis JCM 9140 TaxID=1236970 RepID=W4Q2U5_9BACI|nr:dTDP-4-dehydrorhamnose 3,5-epimerase [Halalkalibacter wakoensis]GAE26270.1 dTDP-4-dehydrorhamnose 3,5-epimerase [Halalkalibacter wakoensis JCM 9140]
MKIYPTKFQDIILLETRRFGDERGFFTESYNHKLFAEKGVTNHFVQDNHSLSSESGTLRGLHYQLNPAAQAKLVRVLAGAIYDVIVDLRQGSPTFGEWESYILSEDNKRQLLVPKGFAHGFCTLVKDTQVFYKVDEYYSPENDRGIAWDDSTLNIPWPTSNPILSEKDQKHPSFEDAEHNFIYRGCLK